MAVSLLMMGTIVDAAVVRADLEKAIAGRNLKYPAAFRECLDFAFDDPMRQKVLILPPGTKIEGNLHVEWSKELQVKNVVAIVAMGDLKVEGSVINDDHDGGPMMFVVGDLVAKSIDKRGAFMVILGNVRLSGPALCEYNHGGLRIGGDLTTELLLNLDHDVLVSGRTIGKSLTGREDDLRSSLVSDVFSSDDPDDSWPDTDLVRKRIAAGHTLLRP